MRTASETFLRLGPFLVQTLHTQDPDISVILVRLYRGTDDSWVDKNVIDLSFLEERGGRETGSAKAT